MEFPVDLFNTISASVLEDVSAAYTQNNLEKLPRTFMGVGPIPPEDECPELVVWISNVRPWDAQSPDGLAEGRLLHYWGIAFDLNVRVSLCYVDFNENGGPLPVKQVNQMTAAVNKYGFVTYTATIDSLKSGNGCSEESGCYNSITPSSMNPFNSGARAGWQFAISIGVL